MIRLNFILKPEAATRGVLCKKVFLECNFIKKETLAQVFSCEFCEISKNTFFNTSGRLPLDREILQFRIAPYPTSLLIYPKFQRVFITLFYHIQLIPINTFLSVFSSVRASVFFHMLVRKK